jgi:alanine dehydrogenase
MKIGIIREGKVPTDRRVALSPSACQEVLQRFPGTSVCVQRSDIRCYADDEYQQAGIEICDDVSDCDILLGIKEVPVDQLLPEKTYLFFSHTIKKQPYNRKLLQALLQKGIRMVDYETLVDDEGQRVIAFGRYAGLVGAYNGLMAYGRRFGLFQLKPAHECFDLAEMKEECRKAQLPPIKIAVTGSGRVAQGALETLAAAGIPAVSSQDFLEKTFGHAVYAQLRSKDYHCRKGGEGFEGGEFFAHPDRYEGRFLPFAKAADLLIAAAYWHPQAPVLFTKEDMRQADFRIRVIADVTCDIEGSIPSTLRPSTIAQPLYDYNPATEQLEAPCSDESHVTVMAVDNLPNELPRDASDSFGRQLIDQVLPALLQGDAGGRIARASITQAGRLTPRYQYLQGFAEGRE